MNTKKRTAFFHTPKAAGNTIIAVTKPDFRFNHGPFESNYAWFKNKRLPGEKWEDVYKFGFVRNPWDRMVSQYFHTMSSKTRERSDLPVEEHFRQWLAYRGVNSMQTQAGVHAMWGMGKLQVDLVGRFEHLREDLEAVAFHTQRPLIGLNNGELPVVNHGKNRPSYEWERYYDATTRDVVAAFHKWEIKLFGYQFADPSSR